MLALLLLAAAVAASPAPQPTPHLKVIVNVKSTALCSAVKSMAVPLGYVTRRNEQAFAAMNHAMLQFMINTAGVTDAGVADLHSLDNSLDDAEMYTPNSELQVTKMNRIAYDVVQNLTLEDQVMNQSWREYPRGKSPSVDALRQRMQNLMDLQRALANQYLEFAGMYLDNRGQAQFSGSPAYTKAFLRSTLLGLSSAMAAASKQRDPEILPQASAHDIAHSGKVGEIVRELRLQDMAFSNEILGAADTCGI